MTSSPRDELLDENGNPDSTRVGGLLESYRDRLGRMIRYRMDPRLRHRVDASDVLQEAYVEVSERLPEFLEQGDVPFFIWVRFIAAQKLGYFHRHHLGAQKRDARKEVPLHVAVAPEVSSVFLADALLHSGDSPSQELLRAERSDLVVEALDSLKPMDREILALRHLEGLTNGECAEILDLEVSAASRRYLRAALRFGDAMRSRLGGADESAL